MIKKEIIKNRRGVAQSVLLYKKNMVTTMLIVDATTRGNALGRSRGSVVQIHPSRPLLYSFLNQNVGKIIRDFASSMKCTSGKRAFRSQ